MDLSFGIPKKLSWSLFFKLTLLFWVVVTTTFTVDYFYFSKIHKEKILLTTIEKMNSLRIEPGIQYFDDEDYQGRFYEHKFLLEQSKVLIVELGKEQQYADFIKQHEGLFNIGKSRPK